MACSPDTVVCELHQVVTALSTPGPLEWITLGATLLTSIVSLFLGVAALRAAAAANRFQHDSRVDELTREAASSRKAAAIEVLAWSAKAVVRPTFRRVTGLVAETRELRDRLRVSGHEGLLSYMDAVDWIARIFPTSFTDEPQVKRRALHMHIARLGVDTWVKDPEAGAAALDEVAQLLKAIHEADPPPPEWNDPGDLPGSTPVETEA
jgi:hypothetical protein